MAQTKRVLSVSYDRDRMDTRNEVLRRAGYDVLCSESVQDAVDKAEKADVVVIGDSVPDNDKRALLSEIRVKAHIPTIVLYGASYSNVQGDATFHVLEGPMKLLQEIKKFVERPR